MISTQLMESNLEVRHAHLYHQMDYLCLLTTLGFTMSKVIFKDNIPNNFWTNHEGAKFKLRAPKCLGCISSI